MYCIDCGGELPTGAAFCPSCGRRVPLQATPEPQSRRGNETAAKAPPDERRGLDEERKRSIYEIHNDERARECEERARRGQEPELNVRDARFYRKLIQRMEKKHQVMEPVVEAASLLTADREAHADNMPSWDAISEARRVLDLAEPLPSDEPNKGCNWYRTSRALKAEGKGDRRYEQVSDLCLRISRAYEYDRGEAGAQMEADLRIQQIYPRHLTDQDMAQIDELFVKIHEPPPAWEGLLSRVTLLLIWGVFLFLIVTFVAWCVSG